MEDAKKPFANFWMIATIILAIALIAVFVFGENNFFGKSVSGSVSSAKGSDVLIKFLTEVYGDRVGNITLNGAKEENGLYKVSVTFANEDGQTNTGDLYVTKDAKLFIPQSIDIDETLNRFRESKSALNSQNTATNTPPGANSSQVPEEEKVESPAQQ